MSVTIANDAIVHTEQRNCQSDITQRDDDKTPLDSAVVVLGTVGDDTANKAQYIDTEIEYGVDQTCSPVRKTELGNKEEQENGVHDVISEAFPHVAQRRSDESFRMMSFGHRHIVDDKWNNHYENGQQHCHHTVVCEKVNQHNNRFWLIIN